MLRNVLLFILLKIKYNVVTIHSLGNIVNYIEWRFRSASQCSWKYTLFERRLFRVCFKIVQKASLQSIFCRCSYV